MLNTTCITAKPGLSGLAQVNGRNAISWEDKIEWDLKYIEKVSLVEDIKIIFKTVTYADTTALEEDFGFKPQTSLRTGLRKFAEWYKEFYK